MDLLQFASEEAAVDLKRRKATEAVVDKARVLIENDEYDKAVQLLETGLPEGTMQKVRDRARPGSKRRCGISKASGRSTRHPPASFCRTTKRGRGEVFGVAPDSFRRSPVYNELLQQAHRDAERWQNIENAIARARQLAGGG